MSKLTANEMMVWGLKNMWTEGREGGYSVRHGCCPVNDVGRPRQDMTTSANAEINLDQPNFLKRHPQAYSILIVVVMKLINICL